MICIGRTKSLSRCKNKCRFLFCRHHRWQLLGALFLPIALSVVANLITALLTGSPKSNPPEAVEDYEKMEGVSIWMVVKPDEVSRGGRKFIIDIGQVEKSRLSIYLDEKNDLCFRIIDDYGEVHTAKLPRKKYVYLDRFSLLTFEYGRSDQYSYVKIILDGKYEAKNAYDYKLDLSIDTSKWKDLKMGADLTGIDSGKFSISEFMLYHVTLNKDEKDKLYGYFMGKYFPEKLSAPQSPES